MRRVWTTRVHAAAAGMPSSGRTFEGETLNPEGGADPGCVGRPGWCMHSKPRWRMHRRPRWCMHSRPRWRMHCRRVCQDKK
eukprot:318-Chlamydomonas_euryale.AAC.2